MAVLVADSTDRGPGRPSGSSGLPSSTSYTVCGWFNDLVVGAPTLLWLSGTGFSNWNFIDDNGSNTRINGRYSDVNNIVTFSSRIPTSGWVFVAMACGGTGTTDLKGYFAQIDDTSFTKAETDGGSFTADELFFGSSDFTGNQAGNEVAFCKVWDAALTEEELWTEMHQGAPARVKDLNAFVPCWSTSNLKDWSTNGNDFSSTGLANSTSMPPVPLVRLASGLVIPAAAAFTAELTTPTFSTSAQSVSVLADYEAALTAPSFSASPQSLSVFEAFNADLTAATFGFTTAAITVLEGFVAALTAASFNTTPNALSVLAAFTAELTAATVTFTAQALDVPTGFDADLTAASLSTSSQSITVLAEFNSALTAAVFSVSPQALTALEEFQADLTAGTFSMTPQSLSVFEDFIVELTAAVLTLSGNSLDVTGDEEEVRKLIRHMTFSYLNRR